MVARLIESGYRRAVAAQNQIDQRSERLVKQSAAFLAAFLILALVLHGLYGAIHRPVAAQDGMAGDRIKPGVLAYAGGPGEYRTPLLA